MTASSVLPAAMPAAAASGTGVAGVGQERAERDPGPGAAAEDQRAARARPVGGHTSEMLWPIEA